MNRMTRVFAVCLGLVMIVSTAVQAMERPRPGEVDDLIAAGEYDSRLAFAYQIGNHRLGSYLMQKLKKRGALAGPGMTAPPPAGQGMPSTGVVRTFILLIEFQDYPHAVDSATVDAMLYGVGNPGHFPQESLAAFYNRSSYGLLDLSEGATLGWYQTAYDRSAVTEDDAGREALVSEAIEHFDAQGHDFSQYDNDGNGVIDYFMVMWTGPDNGWGNFWWGYQTGWTNPAYVVDGVGLGKYSWQWEADHPGVVIHETGHGLGLPDYYDYDVDVGPDGGIGGFDMMDGGVWDHNCFSKWMLGWLTPTVVNGGRQNLTLNRTSDFQDAVLIYPGVTTGDMFSEYYMVQNRQARGNDASGWFDVDGLAVWHIDATLLPDGSWFAYDNSFTDHKLIRLMEADGMEHIETATCDGLVCSNNPAWSCEEDENCKLTDAGDTYKEGDVFSNLTFPSSAAYDGSETCVTLCDIVGSGPTSPISASFTTECSQPPLCEAGGPYLAECNGAATTLTLDGTGSTDPDPDDTLTYFWTTDCPGGVFDDPTSATPVLMLDSSPGCLVECSVSLAVTDCAGNTDGCSTTVTVTDLTVPFIQLPPDITVECDQSTDPEETGAALGLDDCDPAPVVGYFDKVVEGDCPQERVIVRTWIATDECGNSASDSQRIDVVDTTAPVVDCPADVTVTCGDPTDPSVTGTATAVDNCDPGPVVTYEDVETVPDCVASPVMYTITRTWTAVDACGNAGSCDQVITVLKVVHHLDIKPGSCPNSFNRGSNGVLPVSLVGTADFDVSTVDIASLRISRVDCVGGSAAPNEGPKGPHTVTEDVATPFEGDTCDCHELDGDGWLDLSMKFNSPEVNEALQLEEFGHKDTVEVALTGTTADGCAFIAYDCLRIVGHAGSLGGGD